MLLPFCQQTVPDLRRRLALEGELSQIGREPSRCPRARKQTARKRRTTRDKCSCRSVNKRSLTCAGALLLKVNCLRSDASRADARERGNKQPGSAGQPEINALAVLSTNGP